MKDVSIVIASPSAIDRARLVRALTEGHQVKIVAQASDLSETFTLVESLEPDIVLLAEAFTAHAEFDCMRSLFKAVDAAWIGIDFPRAYTSVHKASDRRPVARGPQDGVQSLEDLLERLRKLVPRRKMRVAPSVHAPAPSGMPATDRIILIGASTGGIDALLTVLANFPPDCPPTAIVQHTGHGFCDSLVRLLDKRCAANVVMAQDRLVLAAGTICVAAGGPGHLRLQPDEVPRWSLRPGEAVSGHAPSVDVLFRSAVPLAGRVVAALLTGMGSDGAAGLLDLRRAGAATIGQDERTSVVYGMPRVAQEIGAVQQQLALDQIGARLIKLAGPLRRAGLQAAASHG